MAAVTLEDAPADAAASSSTSPPAATEGAAAAASSSAAAAAAVPAAVPADAVWQDVAGRPRAGFTMADVPGVQLLDGDGTDFSLRIGPDYKKHGKKAPSIAHMYHPLTIDVYKNKKVIFHVGSRVTLPPPPDGHATPNETGLPRRLIVNAIIPTDGPPLMGGSVDGSCFQVVVVFGATAAALKQWQEEATPAYKLFERFIKNAPEGVTPSSGDVDVKERLKLLPKADNISSLGLPGWITGYNGKPALVTKSGALYRGDDYLEICMNTYRFAFLTKKGVHYLLNRLKDFDFHAAFTLEGRDNEELPERTLLAVRIRGLDLPNVAKEVELPAEPGSASVEVS